MFFPHKTRVLHLGARFFLMWVFQQQIAVHVFVDLVMRLHHIGLGLHLDRPHHSATGPNDRTMHTNTHPRVCAHGINGNLNRMGG